MADENDTPETFTREDIEANYVPKDRMTTEIQRRVAAAKTNARKELMDDETFLDELVTSRAEQISQRLNGGSDRNAERERIRREVESAFVNPLKKEIEARDTTLSKLQTRILNGVFGEVANTVGISDDVLPLLTDRYRGRVRWNDEHEDFFLVGEDGEYAMSSKNPFRTLSEELEDIKASGKHPGWFKDQGKAGAGFAGTKGKAGTVSFEEFGKMTSTQRTELYHSNPTLWKEHMAALRQENEQKLKR